MSVRSQLDLNNCRENTSYFLFALAHAMRSNESFFATL